MKNRKNRSQRARRTLLFACSFLIFLLFYIVFLVMEAILGGGLAYLWFLALAPTLFLLYELAVGWISYRLTNSLKATVLDQELALLIYLIFAALADLISGRLPVSELSFSHFLPDILALLCCPVLTLIGGRVARFFAARKKQK
ncbi:MAG: hypothetical protein IJF24_03820 [Clostridia bacterium]|nr:hypothetical protein [Clostridia bacterium]